MNARQPAIFAILIVTMLASICACEAQAIERWPPWQSYGEAENAARAKPKRRAVPSQAEIDTLNRKVDELTAAGDSAKAIALAQRALQLTERRYGRNHAQTAEALTRLADLMVAQRRYGDAEPLLKRALDIREKDKGSSAADIAVALDNLAVLYQKQGRAKEAAPLTQRAVGYRDKQLASDPSKTVPRLKSLEGVARSARRKAPDAQAAAPVPERKAVQQNAPPATAKKPTLDELKRALEGAKTRSLAARKYARPAAPSAAPPAAGGEEMEAARGESPEGGSGAGRSGGGAPPLASAPPGASAPEPDTAPAADHDGQAQDRAAQAAEAARMAEEAAKMRSRERALSERMSRLEAEARARAERDTKEQQARETEERARLEEQARVRTQYEAEERRRWEEAVKGRNKAEAEARRSQAAPGECARGLGVECPAKPETPTAAAPAAPPAAMAARDAAGKDTAAKDTSAEATAAKKKEEERKWDVVPVFYGTDRAEEANPKRVAYNADRGRRLELGRALVTVPKAHEVPQVERPWALRIPYFNVTIYEQKEDPEKHFTMEEIKKLSKEDFLKLVRERLGGSQRFKDQALVFVHGYNTSFDNAVYRTAQIAYDLKFDGAPFLYSWPSGGAVASYTYDRESAEGSRPYMRQFLEMVVKETGAKHVSIIAHSMGNQPLLDVLKDMKAATPEGVVISQVILAAPDVDADNFANLAQAINGLASGVTLYAASNDRALIVSRNFWGHSRAGDVPAGGPLVLPGVDTIDVTAVSTDTFALNHSGYAQNNKLLTDIGELLLTGVRPPDERALKPERVGTQKGPYWRYGAPPTGSVGASPP